jgi:hypothetical protein
VVRPHGALSGSPTGARELAQDSLRLALHPRALRGLEADRLEKLQLIVRSSSSPYFKAAVARWMPPPLDSAQSMVEQVGSDFMIVTDVNGRIVARTDFRAHR